MKRKMSVKLLRRLLDYDPVAGTFKWRWRTSDLFQTGQRSAEQVCAVWNARYSGKAAGCINFYGYLVIRVLDVDYQAHRVASAMMSGRWPRNEIDHKDGRTDICVWENLRPATHQQNRLNNKVYANNTSGHPGVGWMPKKGRWRARIKLAGRERHLGLFKTKRAAIEARDAAACRLFGKFNRAQLRVENEAREMQ